MRWLWFQQQIWIWPRCIRSQMAPHPPRITLRPMLSGHHQDLTGLKMGLIRCVGVPTPIDLLTSHMPPMKWACLLYILRSILRSNKLCLTKLEHRACWLQESVQ